MLRINPIVAATRSETDLRPKMEKIIPSIGKIKPTKGMNAEKILKMPIIRPAIAIPLPCSGVGILYTGGA